MLRPRSLILLTQTSTRGMLSAVRRNRPISLERCRFTALRSFSENLGAKSQLQQFSRFSMMVALGMSAAACSAFGSAVERNALSSLRNVTPCRRSGDLHEVVSVQVIRRLKGKIPADAHRQRTDHRIADLEVVIQEA
jgi:hypothetical protein